MKGSSFRGLQFRVSFKAYEVWLATFGERLSQARLDRDDD